MVLFVSFGHACVCVSDALLSAPLNVTIRELEVNSAVVTWEILEGDPVIGFAITQQVPLSMLRTFYVFGQEKENLNTQI